MQKKVRNRELSISFVNVNVTVVFDALSTAHYLKVEGRRYDVCMGLRTTVVYFVAGASAEFHLLCASLKVFDINKYA